MNRLVTSFVILAMSVGAYAGSQTPPDSEAAGGIIYGQTWAFIISAPAGWSMTRQSGLPVSAAFFQEQSPEPNSHKPSPFMYVTVPTVDAQTPTLTELQQQDEADFRGESKNLIVSSGPELSAADKQPVIVRRFDNTRDGRSELVAYHRYGDAMYKIVFTAPSGSSLGQHEPSFAKQVSSFAGMHIKFEPSAQQGAPVDGSPAASQRPARP
jgi:hypothetical protein